jgi:glutamate/aspartate transport system substrate-binding protein
MPKMKILWCVLTMAAMLSVAQADTLEKIRESRKIVIGYRPTSPPFSFKNSVGTAEGYQVDLCARIATSLKTTLKIPDLNVEYREVTSQQRIPAVKSGEIDIECASTTMTSERFKEVDFSYATFITGIWFAAKRDSKLLSMRDLMGKVVAAGKGTTAERLLNAAQTTYEFGRIVKVETTAFKALEAGEADAAFNDEPLLITNIFKSKSPEAYQMGGSYLSVEPYGLMIRKNDEAFKTEINKALVVLFKSGEAKNLHERWFDHGTVPIPMNNLTKETFKYPSSLPAYP